MPNYPLEDITDLKKTQLDIAQDPYVLSVKPEPAKVVNTKSGGLKAVLRNEFDKIVRGRVTLQQIQEELKVLRAQNVVGKGEPAMGWKLQDPETAKQIECQSKGEFNLEVRRCVLIKKMMKAGQDCKNYLVAIVAKMKTEKQAKQEHKMQEKALKREKNLEMLKPSGELMSSKVALFKEALQLEGDPSEWSSEVLATKLDAGTGRRLCEEAFAAKREEREARSLMISAKESAEILRRFGAGARKSEKKKKVREPFLATVEKVKAQSEESRKPRGRMKKLSHPCIKKVLKPLAAAVAGAYSSPPPLVKMESSGSKKRVFIDLLSDSDDDRRAHKKKAKVEGVSSKEQVNVEEAAPTDEGLWTCERCTFNENPFNFLACSVCFHPQSIDEEFTPELATALQPASIKVITHAAATRRVQQSG
eukprot:g73799.t1